MVCGGRVETGSLVFVNKNGERKGENGERKKQTQGQKAHAVFSYSGESRGTPKVGA